MKVFIEKILHMTFHEVIILICFQTEVDKIQEEQYNLRQQNEKLKEKLNEQADTLKSLDEKLNLLIERLPEQQR